MSLAKLIVLLSVPPTFLATLLGTATCATLPSLFETISKLLLALVIVLIVGSTVKPPVVVVVDVEANCCIAVNGIRALDKSVLGSLDPFLPLELLSNLMRNSKLPEALLLVSSLSPTAELTPSLLPTAIVFGAIFVESLKLVVIINGVVDVDAGADTDADAGVVGVLVIEGSSGMLLFPA